MSDSEKLFNPRVRNNVDRSNIMMALAHAREITQIHRWAFQVDDLLQPLLNFPENIIPECRKRRSYVSSILAKNEINRSDIYNKKLFLRVRRGFYILNPDLKLRIDAEWIKVYEMLQLEGLGEQGAQLAALSVS